MTFAGSLARGTQRLCGWLLLDASSSPPVVQRPAEGCQMKGLPKARRVKEELVVTKIVSRLFFFC